MAALDYFAIASSIGSTLAADAALSGVRILVEEEFSFGLADVAKAVGIYADSRAPTQEQPLAAGKRTRFEIQFRLWCVGFSMESIKSAIALRDDLIGPVELSLMASRTFGRSDIESSRLNGGELFSARNPNSGQLMAGGEVLLTVTAVAINA